MSGSRTERTARQAREDRFAEAARLVRGFGLSADALADLTGASESKTAQWMSERKPASMPLHDVPALPSEARIAACEWALGPGYVVAEVPAAEHVGDDFALAAHVARELADVSCEHAAELQRAVSSGGMSRGGVRGVRREIREAMRALATLDARLAIVEREGVDGLRVVRGEA